MNTSPVKRPRGGGGAPSTPGASPSTPWPPSTPSTASAHPPSLGPSLRRVLAVVASTLVLASLVMGIYYYLTYGSNNKRREEPKATPSPSTSSSDVRQTHRPPIDIFGFLPEYRLDAADLERFADVTTHIIFFSVELDHAGTGQLAPGAGARLPSPERIAEVRKGSKVGTKMWLAVGGAGRSEGFARAARDVRSRRRLASAIADLVKSHGLDGIEVNWQFPTSMEDVKALKELAADLKRSSLGLQVSHAVPVSADYARALATTGAHQVLDRFHVMLYLEGIGTQTGQDPLDLAQATLTGLTKYLPADKVTLGVPFYGTSTRGDGTTKTHEELLTLPRQDRQQMFYHEDGDVLRRKLDLAKSLGLAGVAIWELGSDCRTRGVGNHVSTCMNRRDSLLEVVREWSLAADSAVEASS